MTSDTYVYVLQWVDYDDNSGDVLAVYATEADALAAAKAIISATIHDPTITARAWEYGTDPEHMVWMVDTPTPPERTHDNPAHQRRWPDVGIFVHPLPILTAFDADTAVPTWIPDIRRHHSYD